MKRLTVMRHAKSSWDQPDRDDFDRPLNERGWKAARRIGRELKHRNMRFDLCLASPAARVRETLDGLARGYGDLGFPVHFVQEIYMADAATLRDLVSHISDDVTAPLLVGHNPALERLVAMLTRDDDQTRRERVEHKFPTAALAAIEFPASRWVDVAPASGTIAELLLPKELD